MDKVKNMMISKTCPDVAGVIMQFVGQDIQVHKPGDFIYRTACGCMGCNICKRLINRCRECRLFVEHIDDPEYYCTAKSYHLHPIQRDVKHRILDLEKNDMVDSRRIQTGWNNSDHFTNGLGQRKIQRHERISRENRSFNEIDNFCRNCGCPGCMNFHFKIQAEWGRYMCECSKCTICMEPIYTKSYDTKTKKYKGEITNNHSHRFICIHCTKKDIDKMGYNNHQTV